MESPKIELDELDKRIIQHAATGVYSYDELAKLCNVTRGTVYRRIGRLERLRAITRRIMAIPNFSKLNLSAICLGIELPPEDETKAINILKTLADMKMLWRCYGEHQIVAVVLCEVGCEGGTISKIRESLSELRIQQIHASIGFVWEKVDLTPY